MRILAVVILVLSFQSSLKANDIEDFQIEGISLFDSALNFFTKDQIKNGERNYYKNKEFTPVEINGLPFFKTYDSVDFEYKANDRNYKIYGLNGIIDYSKNIDNCYSKMDSIVYELDNLLKNNTVKEKKKVLTHSIDPTGKSKVTRVNFYFKDKSRIMVSCYDYSNESGYQDHLGVAIKSKKVIDFLAKAYD